MDVTYRDRKYAQHDFVIFQSHQTRIPSPVDPSKLLGVAVLTVTTGFGLAALDAASGGGAGKGALGGGAGGPSPTTGMPKSSSGNEDLVFKPLLTLVLDPGLGGKGDAERRPGSGSGMILSSLGSSPSSERVGVREANRADDSDCCAARAATLLAEREGFMPRMGIARASSVGPACELRTEVKNGAGSERTCKLVGRRNVRPLPWACICVVRCVGDEEDDRRAVVGCEEMPSRSSGCSAKSESLERGPSEGVGVRAGALESRCDGSTFADNVCIAGVSPAASGS